MSTTSDLNMLPPRTTAVLPNIAGGRPAHDPMADVAAGLEELCELLRDFLALARNQRRIDQWETEELLGLPHRDLDSDKLRPCHHPKT